MPGLPVTYRRARLYLELRPRDPLGDEQAAAEFEVLSLEIMRLDRVVKTFLDFTRPVELNLALVPLRELMGEIVDLARPQADASQIRINMQEDTEGVAVRIDRDLLKQAVLNVVVNAMEAMPQGGALIDTPGMRELQLWDLRAGRRLARYPGVRGPALHHDAEIAHPFARRLQLTGEPGARLQHQDSLAARGVFFGMDADTAAEAMVQAVLEGVALSIAEAQDLLAQAGTDVARIAAIGGGSRSRLWMRILANALDRPVVLYRESAKGPAFGAARLARLAVTGERVEEVCTVAPVSDVIEPEPALVDAYRSAGAKFRRLYRTVKLEFRP
jgi:hypothetical protein